MHCLIAASLAAALVCAGCANLNYNPTYQNNLDWSENTCPKKAAKHFDHVVIIALENENDHAGPDKRASYLDGFIKMVKELKKISPAIGVAHFTNFHGLFHPSYSNYLAMVSGSPLESRMDGQQNYSHLTIADRLEEKEMGWANYAEGYPGKNSCFTESSYPYQHYVRKYVPFLSFIRIRGQRCIDHIIPIVAPCKCQTGGKSCENDAEKAAEDFLDKWKKSKPAYAIYTPNQKHNGHDTDLKASTEWLRGFLNKTLSDSEFIQDKNEQGTLVIVTFDESASNFSGDSDSIKDHKDLYNENKIDTFFIGKMINDSTVPAKQSIPEKPYLPIPEDNHNHFNVLRTIEENFGLCPMGEMDRKALPITGIWNN